MGRRLRADQGPPPLRGDQGLLLFEVLHPSFAAAGRAPAWRMTCHARQNFSKGNQMISKRESTLTKSDVQSAVLTIRREAERRIANEPGLSLGTAFAEERKKNAELDAIISLGRELYAGDDCARIPGDPE
jgi:hypothetical protein